MRLGETCVVAATFQEARHFTPATALRYRDLVERAAFVCALGEGLPVEPLPGVRGPRSPRATRCAASGTSSWSAPTSAPPCWPATSGREGPDLDRAFEYALTYDRETVVRAAHALLTRVTPLPRGPAVSARPRSSPRPSAGQRFPAPVSPTPFRGTPCSTGRSRPPPAACPSWTCGCPTSRWSTSTPPSRSCRASPARRSWAATAASCRAPTPTGRPSRASGRRSRPARSAARRCSTTAAPIARPGGTRCTSRRSPTPRARSCSTWVCRST